MENLEGKNVNLIIKNEEDNKGEFSISFRSIFKNLKRFFAIWIALTIIVSILSMLILALGKVDEYKKTSSLISFTFDGIEKGLDPNGNKFDVTTIKNPQIIEKALHELDMPVSQLENVRKSISFEGIIPQDKYDEITAYKEIISNSTGSSTLAAVEKVLETKYYPTKFNVFFNYSNMDINSTDAATLLNKILECYSKYFLDSYGYNETFGSAIKALDYTDYDYAEALDVFDSSLTSLRSYVNAINSSDKTRFRSTKTGYTFADLSNAIDTLQTVDMDKISSDVTLHVITKDKESLRTYYQYRIEALQRHENVCREELATITDLIASYEKNTVQIFGNGTDNINTTSTEASAEYDDLFNKKLNKQSDLSTTIQKINLYNTRLERLNSEAVGTKEQIETVEANLEKLNEKVNTLIEDVKTSADEFYETVVFSRSFNILVPASTSTVNVLKNSIKDSVLIVAIIDALIFIIYLTYSLILAITFEQKKNNSVTNQDKTESITTKNKE